MTVDLGSRKTRPWAGNFAISPPEQWPSTGHPDGHQNCPCQEIQDVEKETTVTSY
jgi:hypothetical protein